MLIIPTYIKNSTIQGTGLFAAENIKAHTQLVKIVPEFDRCYTADEIAKLPKEAKNFIERYSYLDKWDGKYYIALDNARFTNHADTPNTYYNDKGDWMALRDIKKDEEITTNYSEFDQLSENIIYKKAG